MFSSNSPSIFSPSFLFWAPSTPFSPIFYVVFYETHSVCLLPEYITIHLSIGSLSVVQPWNFKPWNYFSFPNQLSVVNCSSVAGSTIWTCQSPKLEVWLVYYYAGLEHTVTAPLIMDATVLSFHSILFSNTNIHDF